MSKTKAIKKIDELLSSSEEEAPKKKNYQKNQESS